VSAIIDSKLERAMVVFILLFIVTAFFLASKISELIWALSPVLWVGGFIWLLWYNEILEQAFWVFLWFGKWFLCIGLVIGLIRAFQRGCEMLFFGSINHVKRRLGAAHNEVDG
jgi:hypothetical protein